jgi:hypothetical protein
MGILRIQNSEEKKKEEAEPQKTYENAKLQKHFNLFYLNRL